MSNKEKFIENLDQDVFQSQDTSVKNEIDKSIKALKVLDFPTSKTEKWKYSRVGKIVNSDYSPNHELSEVNSEVYNIQDLDCFEFVFVNGKLDSNKSSIVDINGMEVREIIEHLSSSDSLNQMFGKGADSSEGIFTALNTAFLSCGLNIHVEKNIQVEKPIHIVFINTKDNNIWQPRNLIQVEKGSKAEVIISFIDHGDNACFVNHVSEIFVENNAHLECTVLQEFGSKSHLINEVSGIQKSDSKLQINTFTNHSNWVRNNSNIQVEGKNCTTNLFGSYLPRNKEHIDNHTIIDHLDSHCESNELFKGILDDQSTGVFNGKVFVREDSQKTNAYQQNANILLSDTAQMNSKPELEIYADDVKCSHGSTTGQFDSQALYYLKARGIAEKNAKKLLVNAFINEVIDEVSNEDLRIHIQKLMDL